MRFIPSAKVIIVLSFFLALLTLTYSAPTTTPASPIYPITPRASLSNIIAPGLCRYKNTNTRSQCSITTLYRPSTYASIYWFNHRCEVVAYEPKAPTGPRENTSLRASGYMKATVVSVGGQGYDPQFWYGGDRYKFGKDESKKNCWKENGNEVACTLKFECT